MFEERLNIEIGGEKFDLSDVMREVTKKKIAKVVTIEDMLAVYNDIVDLEMTPMRMCEKTVQ